MSTLTIRELTKEDRCDSSNCNAASTVALQFKTGELMFCGHHYMENHPALMTSGAIIVGQAKVEQ